MGLFTVKYRPGSFNDVAPDLKLEQTIQRNSQGPGGHVVRLNIRHTWEKMT